MPSHQYIKSLYFTVVPREMSRPTERGSKKSMEMKRPGQNRQAEKEMYTPYLRRGEAAKEVGSGPIYLWLFLAFFPWCEWLIFEVHSTRARNRQFIEHCFSIPPLLYLYLYFATVSVVLEFLLITAADETVDHPAQGILYRPESFRTVVTMFLIDTRVRKSV
jgi:hypothetical protein